MEPLKYWSVEFKKIKLAFGMAEGRFRVCPLKEIVNQALNKFIDNGTLETKACKDCMHNHVNHWRAKDE